MLIRNRDENFFVMLILDAILLWKYLFHNIIFDPALHDNDYNYHQ